MQIILASWHRFSLKFKIGLYFVKTSNNNQQTKQAVPETTLEPLRLSNSVFAAFLTLHENWDFPGFGAGNQIIREEPYNSSKLLN